MTADKEKLCKGTCHLSERLAGQRWKMRMLCTVRRQRMSRPSLRPAATQQALHDCAASDHCWCSAPAARLPSGLALPAGYAVFSAYIMNVWGGNQLPLIWKGSFLEESH